MDNDWLGFFNRNRLSINLPERLPVPREVLDFRHASRASLFLVLRSASRLEPRICIFFLIERLTQPQVSAKLHANWDVGALWEGRHVCKRE